MNNKIIFLMVLVMTMVWTAGCSCPGTEPPVVAAPVAAYVPPPAPRPVVTKPCPPSKTCEGTCLLLRSLSDILR